MYMRKAEGEIVGAIKRLPFFITCGSSLFHNLLSLVSYMKNVSNFEDVKVRGHI